LLRLTRTTEGVREEHLSAVRFVPLVAGIPGEAVQGEGLAGAEIPLVQPSGGLA